MDQESFRSAPLRSVCFPQTDKNDRMNRTRAVFELGFAVGVGVGVGFGWFVMNDFTLLFPFGGLSGWGWWYDLI